MTTMKKIIETRFSSANNVNVEFVKYLKNKKIEIDSSEKKYYALIEGKKYAISVTSHNQDYADCRQFSEECDGLITLHEKTGRIYLFPKSSLSRGTKSREFSSKKYFSIKSIYKFSDRFSFSLIDQINYSTYRDMYIKVAKAHSKTIVSKAFEIFS